MRVGLLLLWLATVSLPEFPCGGVAGAGTGDGEGQEREDSYSESSGGELDYAVDRARRNAVIENSEDLFHQVRIGLHIMLQATRFIQRHRPWLEPRDQAVQTDHVHILSVLPQTPVGPSSSSVVEGGGSSSSTLVAAGGGGDIAEEKARPAPKRPRTLCGHPIGLANAGSPNSGGNGKFGHWSKAPAIVVEDDAQRLPDYWVAWPTLPYE